MYAILPGRLILFTDFKCARFRQTREQLWQLRSLPLYGVFIWQMPSFGCERTVVTAAAEALGEGMGGLAPEFVCAHAHCERRHGSRGCISFPLAGALCCNSKFLASCHSLCWYSWIQSECFRDFSVKTEVRLRCRIPIRFNKSLPYLLI